ncbi:MAG: ferrous iron transport protein A [Deltaproteobacteria bacterium]|jgi:Fe2+ transport system protein FeoA|nr:ferrous iron transport protein A [Deltaproteobacteria bacterium]
MLSTKTEQTALADVDACILAKGQCAAAVLHSLDDMPEGAQILVRHIQGNCKLRSHLYALGFTPGARLVVLGQGDEVVRVKVCETSIVLNGDSASNILCELVKSGN